MQVLEYSQPFFWVIIGFSGIIALSYCSVFVFPSPFGVNYSAQAKIFHKMFGITLILTGIVFFITQVLLFLFPFIYRFSPKRKALYFPKKLKLELAWTLIPFCVFMFLLIISTINWWKISNPKYKDPVIIEVSAEQFNWSVRYPGKDRQLGSYSFSLLNDKNRFGLDWEDKRTHDDFTSIQLHIPKNKPVKIFLRSRDVIHSFFIPDFKIKMDAVPGMVTSVEFIATKSTQEMRKIRKDSTFNYEVACAELCGRLHFAMSLILVVDEDKDFKKWYNSQTPVFTVLTQ